MMDTPCEPDTCEAEAGDHRVETSLIYAVSDHLDYGHTLRFCCKNSKHDMCGDAHFDLKALGRKKQANLQSETLGVPGQAFQEIPNKLIPKQEQKLKQNS